MESMSQKLRNLCGRRPESQAAIAAAAGISPQRLNDILQGRKPLSMNLVVPICRAVGSDPNELFGWREPGMNILSDQFTKMVVLDVTAGEEIAVVTNELITTAGDEIVVKLTPAYD